MVPGNRLFDRTSHSAIHKGGRNSFRLWDFFSSRYKQQERPSPISDISKANEDAGEDFEVDNNTEVRFRKSLSSEWKHWGSFYDLEKQKHRSVDLRKILGMAASIGCPEVLANIQGMLDSIITQTLDLKRPIALLMNSHKRSLRQKGFAKTIKQRSSIALLHRCDNLEIELHLRPQKKLKLQANSNNPVLGK